MTKRKRGQPKQKMQITFTLDLPDHPTSLDEIEQAVLQQVREKLFTALKEQKKLQQSEG